MLPLLMTLLAACADPNCDAAPSGASITPEVTQAGDTPVRRVKWTTSEETTGKVRYGVGKLDMEVVDDVVGTEHDLFVAGIGAGDDWQLQVVSSAGGETWTSEVIDIESAPAPTNMSLPELTVEPGDEVEGFEVLPLPSREDGFLVVLNRLGQVAWWASGALQPVYRAQYDATAQTLTWFEQDLDQDENAFVTSTLDRVETRILAADDVHHDFARTPEGAILTLQYADRQVDGATIREKTLVEISPEGIATKLWNSWDAFGYPGGGKINEDGTVEWPHANSIHYDAERRKVLISLFYLDGIAQIDRDTGALDWVLGGEESDWIVEGAGFAGQHGPMSFDGGTGLAVMNNGEPGGGAEVGQAIAYELDEATMTATPSWSFDHDGLYTGVILGGVEWLGNDTAMVNWGSAGALERVNGQGEVRWGVSFRLGAFIGFSNHIDEFAGATR